MSSLSASLAARRCEPEVMDGPDLDPQLHDRALAGLARLNRWAGSARIVRGPIGALIAAVPGPLTLLDVACGAGDVPLALRATAVRRGWPLAVRGCDRSPVAVAHAARAAERAGVDSSFFVADALAGPPLPAADIVTCSLFMHHLQEDEAAALLARLAAASRRLLLVTDLRRSRAGLLLAAGAARLATRSAVVHADAPASVRAAFTLEEAGLLARRAGLRDARLTRVFPWRWMLRWSPA